MVDDFSDKELRKTYGVSYIINDNNMKQDVEQISSENSPPKDKLYFEDPNNNLDSCWNKLNDQLTDCTLCPLSLTRTNIVFGEGNIKSPLMFVGEAPGEQEDKTGRPFVGRAGQLLTKMIEAMGYQREEVYIGNIVKCRPPGNRDPLPIEVNCCIQFITKQIELIKPKVIVCLGSTAAKHLLNIDYKISSIRGKFQKLNETTLVMPTYHPAYLLRNNSKKREVWEDLKQVMNILKS